jgi:RNA polymerase sigma factor (sigma-70 family)
MPSPLQALTSRNRHRTPDDGERQSMDGNGIQNELAQLHPSSYGWALACCGWNRHEAEEVLQTSYLKAIEGRARFNGHSSTRTWFFAVVRTTALEQRRYRAVRYGALGRWLRGTPTPEPVATPEALSGQAEQHERLRKLLQRLSTRQREILHLVFYQDLTIEDAAHVLSISVGSARTHYQRGKAQLRKLLTEAEGR